MKPEEVYQLAINQLTGQAGNTFKHVHKLRGEMVYLYFTRPDGICDPTLDYVTITWQELFNLSTTHTLSN